MPSSTIDNSVSHHAPLAISIGEVAGIGPEIILKCWQQRKAEKLPAFFVTGSLAIMRDYAELCGLEDALVRIDEPSQASALFPRHLPVLDIDVTSSLQVGKATPATAPLVVGAIEKAVELIFAGKASGLVTAPIQKSVLYEAGFTFPGHTEFLAELCARHTGKKHTSVMMLASSALKVVPLTIHMALSQVPGAITEALIHQTATAIIKALKQDFGLEQPLLAISGLNPHAGEDGAMGSEEQDIILPAIKKLQASGLNVTGPHPADTMFHKEARARYDAALCMYHDQALIPIKTLDFDGGVNVTLGLPIVRTSPDHGTALDLAGQGKANATSMLGAIKMAHEIARNRMKTHE